MGQLLQLEGHRRPPRVPIVSGSAKILFFTGVRYDRGTPPAPAPHSSARGRRKRG